MRIDSSVFLRNYDSSKKVSGESSDFIKGFSLKRGEDGSLQMGEMLGDEEQTAKIRLLTPDTLKAMMEQNMAHVRYTYTQNKGLNTAENSISLVNGVKINMGNGEYLAIKDGHIMPNDGRGGNNEDNRKAATALNYLIRIANGQYSYDEEMQSREFYTNSEYQRCAISALENAGINTSKPFNVNGTQFVVKNGVINKA